jgi:hypothetical protein
MSGGGAGGSVAGSGGSTGGISSGGSSGGVACESPIASSTLGEIQTVGIVEWSTNLAGVTSAEVQFGLDTSYGMAAPVEPVAASNRTLLLGMKQNKTYHYRIVAKSPAGDCFGPDQTIQTGALPTGLPNIQKETRNAAELYGGFLIAGQYVQGGAGTGSPAFILDKDGEFVWAYIMPMRDVTGVRPSYDGQYMWMMSANVPENQGANVRRISMDGSMIENFSDEFEGANHQMTVLPDETVGFYAYGNGCDDIKEFNPSTRMVKTIINSGTAHGAGTPCHVNAIEYSPTDDSYLFSDLDNDNITKVTRSGEVVWVIGGSTNDFSGTGTTWSRQHGIDVLGEDKFVFFNNGMMGSSGSVMIEMTLDLQAMSASRTWTYTDADNLRNDVMGDVQRMDNGNTMVAYSTKGVLQEVNAAGEVLEELVWALPGAYGYIQKRKTLYGPPPR